MKEQIACIILSRLLKKHNALNQWKRVVVNYKYEKPYFPSKPLHSQIYSLMYGFDTKLSNKIMREVCYLVNMQIIKNIKAFLIMNEDIAQKALNNIKYHRADFKGTICDYIDVRFQQYTKVAPVSLIRPSSTFVLAFSYMSSQEGAYYWYNVAKQIEMYVSEKVKI